ncbi:MAG: hypothetical protein CVV18_00945 [Gammaproteobacteria bacterium HGW-Gammaproteobacteria-8]|nr:MAG: hypothetical protein CVV18_00945 [Gammaproteobacteria bacterium HGW-Gammaproteobacteria-8]
MNRSGRTLTKLGCLLIGLGLALPALTLAQPDASKPAVYRVELIVFEHVDGRSDRRAAADALNFTDALDPDALAQFSSAIERHLQSLAALLPNFSLPPRTGPEAAALVRADQQIQPLPHDYASAPMSPEMTRALSRLEDSPAHLPVATAAWFQPAERGARSTRVRVHDAETVAMYQPPPPPRPLFLPDLGPLLGRDLPFESIPVARPIYRLDGTARLRRTQFLRLELDLVLQSAPEADDTLGDPRWQLHRLEQARAVRPGRFEYFDSSRFGVLALITEFEWLEPEPPPEPASEVPTTTVPANPG